MREKKRQARLSTYKKYLTETREAIWSIERFMDFVAGADDAAALGLADELDATLASVKRLGDELTYG
jgi:hypothetical protein